MKAIVIAITRVFLVCSVSMLWNKHHCLVVSNVLQVTVHLIFLANIFSDCMLTFLGYRGDGIDCDDIDEVRLIKYCNLFIYLM